MKKLISTLSFILFVGLIAVSAQSTGSEKASKKTDNKLALADNKEAGIVKVYYFHATRRCATCQAVEDISQKTIKENYGPEVNFESINREEDKDNPLIEKYEIGGQTLLLLKGDEKTDLTNEAFLNARTKPDKFAKKLKSTIDSML
jgi:hypothetical protein